MDCERFNRMVKLRVKSGVLWSMIRFFENWIVKRMMLFVRN